MGIIKNLEDFEGISESLAVGEAISMKALQSGELWRTIAPSKERLPLLLLILASEPEWLNLVPVTFAETRGSPGSVYTSHYIFGQTTCATIWLPLRVSAKKAQAYKILSKPISFFSDYDLILWLNNPSTRVLQGNPIDVEPVTLFDRVYDRRDEIEEDLYLLLEC